MFKSYYQITEEDKNQIFDNSLLVCDTNVLLNLYRYKQSTRDSLINILENTSGRWIPHTVALEFFRNRKIVIADQIKRFAKARATINKAVTSFVSELHDLDTDRRHSLIDLTELQQNIEDATRKARAHLNNSEQLQIQLTGPDPVLDIVTNLFDERIGSRPKSQRDLDAIYEDAQRRFDLRRPPGYADVGKGKSEDSYFFENELQYNRKYNDYLIWFQVLCHCKEISASKLIFVTDDIKDDWWEIIDANGKRRIGPRIELIQEALSVGGVELFQMYDSSQLLVHGNEFINQPVSQEQVNEISKVTKQQAHTILNRESKPIYRLADWAIFNYLQKEYDGFKIEQNQGFPDYVVFNESEEVAVEIIFTYDLSQQLFDFVIDKFEEYDPNKCMKWLMVVIAGRNEVDDAFTELISNYFLSLKYDNIEVNVGEMSGHEYICCYSFVK